MENNSTTVHRLPFWAAVLTAFICILFGSNAVAIKISLEGMGVFTTASIRFAMAAFTVGAWAVITGRKLCFDRRYSVHLLGACLIFVCQLSLFYLGISKTHASRGTLIVNLQPFFILFLAHFFIPGDRITTRKFVGMLIGFTGVVFVFLEKSGGADDLQVGDFIILSATFLWACNAVYTKRIIDHFDPYQLVLYPMMFAAPIFLLEGFLWDDQMIQHLDGRIIGSLLYQGLATGSFGFVAWISLLRKYGAVALHSFIFIMPIAGVTLGGWLLGEPITIKILFALFFIVSGILVVHLRTQKPVPIYHPGRNV